MLQPSAHSSHALELGQLVLGRTIPSLLDEACEHHPNDHAINQWQAGRWRSHSIFEVRRESEEIALGLLSLGLQRGDRLALVMQNSLSFCLVDLGSLLAGLVNVPIDLTQTIENILFILQHCQAKVLVVSNVELLSQLIPYLWEATTLHTVLVAEVPPNWSHIREELTTVKLSQSIREKESVTSVLRQPDQCLQLPQLLGESAPSEVSSLPFPHCIRLMSLAEAIAQGQQQWTLERVNTLRDTLRAQDLATLIYIASDTARPKGVMLTHENITSNVLAAFSSYPDLAMGGAKEVALLFLPLTHIFARVFWYGHLVCGHSLYLSDPNHVVKHLRTVRPTILITVPRFLEKMYDRIMERSTRLTRLHRWVFRWAMDLARTVDVSQPPKGWQALTLRLADRLVFQQWRVGLGDRLKAIICGGAALRADLVTYFTVAGIPILQGYGLTETSGVLCYNRPTHNRAGTVGQPIPGVKMVLAEDGEILVKAPMVTQGYYHDPVSTAAVFDADGWFRTGDLGERSVDGFLTITGMKKPLFKLSTGKYVSLLPLEASVGRSPLVKQAIAVGANQKFCAMLIFPNLEALRIGAQEWDLDLSSPNWLKHPRILALYQALIDAANCHLPDWSTIRRFRLMKQELTVANGGLQTDGGVNRAWVLEQFSQAIHELYTGREKGDRPILLENLEPLQGLPFIPELNFTCPTYARSFLHH
jgi:long-chain acyl-CoA synthetase